MSNSPLLRLLRSRRQLLTYLLGGVLSALIDVGLMQLLIWSGSGHVAAASAGFAAGLMFNYLFHAGVTFTAAPSGASLARYLTVVAANYLLTLACVSLAVHLGLAAVAGKLVSLPLVAANGYVLGKRWIFR
jgi:putative flippase GtrA